MHAWQYVHAVCTIYQHMCMSCHDSTCTSASAAHLGQLQLRWLLDRHHGELKALRAAPVLISAPDEQRVVLCVGQRVVGTQGQAAHLRAGAEVQVWVWVGGVGGGGAA